MLYKIKPKYISFIVFIYNFFTPVQQPHSLLLKFAWTHYMNEAQYSFLSLNGTDLKVGDAR